MAIQSFQTARTVVLDHATILSRPARETVALDEAAGRVLAQAVCADRDQPPFARVTRDGFAVRAADVMGATNSARVALRVVGEVPAGRVFEGQMLAGTAVEIMTGAPLPQGADAVVMVEDTDRPAPDEVRIGRAVGPGDNVVPRGSELGAGAVALPAGRRLDAAGVGLLASLGVTRPSVFARPRVALLSTGDEIVPVAQRPEAWQIRNSNLHALAAQVRRAGAEPVMLPIAPDDPERLEILLLEAFSVAELVLVSGGVSMGKHDHVENVLRRIGAEAVFDGVAIRPGKPLVFGIRSAAGVQKAFFGLPGNPLSTFVTFELFARPLLDRLAGVLDETVRPWRPGAARLGEDWTQKPLTLTMFAPVTLRADGDGGSVIWPLRSQGSGDLTALAQADAFMMLPPGTTQVPKHTWVPVIPK